MTGAGKHALSEGTKDIERQIGASAACDSRVWNSIYLSRGSGYWENLGSGWDLNPLPFSALYNQPVFVWQYGDTTRQWTHETVSALHEQGGANLPAPTGPLPPTPAAPMSTATKWAIGGAIVLAGGAAAWAIWRWR